MRQNKKCYIKLKDNNAKENKKQRKDTNSTKTEIR